MLDNIAKIEKSNVMEEHYAQSSDPWGNRESQRYMTVLKYGAKRLFELCDKPVIKYYDIGCGGGNIIDVMIANCPENRTILSGGCDISKSAINYLIDNYPVNYGFDVVDLEEYNSKETPIDGLATADIVTIVDVMYYFGDKRDYRLTLDEIWNTIKPGAIVLVADTIIPYQRRSYFKSKPDCEVLEEYTDYTEACGHIRGTNKSRYLKVKIYRKIEDKE